jgi:hypothetical protein
METMMSYQTLLHELAPDLNHLPRETFAAETKLAADLEVQSPGILRKIAESMGMADDFAKWEASHAA